MKQEIKTKSASKQTSLSLAILVALAVIAGGVFMTQFSYYPAVRQQASISAAGEQREPAPARATESSMISPPAGQAPMTPMEIFDAATLSDKINGKAELYLSAGFKSLHSQRFKTDSAVDVWLEAFVYDMQTPQNAFSVFSAQRRSDARKIDLGQYGYQTSNALFIVHGPFYVEIIASDTSEFIIEPMLALAAAFIEAQPIEETRTIGEKAVFPKGGLIEDSISLVSADAFGYDGFDRIFTASYQLGGTELMAFFSRRASPQESQGLAAGYTDFLIAFGGSSTASDLTIPAVKVIEILDTYEVVFSYGLYLAGVREATDKQQAQELALQLYNGIKGVQNE